jgi:ATP-binding cassette subfamily G (WHITE) protein 2 (SNQ2)
MINMQSIIPFLVKRRAAFYREQSSYMYDSHAYAMAHFTVEVPWIAAILLGLVWIVYFMIPLSSDPGTFFFHLVCCFGLSVVFVSVGTLLAVSMPSMETAQLVASPLSSICMLFGGLFAPTDSIAVGLRWLTYIDPINYGFRALLPVHFYCTGAPYSLPNSNQVLQQGCPTIQVPTLAAGLVTMDRWAYTEKTYSFDYGNRYNNFGILFIFVVVFQMMVFYNNKHKRFIVR